MLSDLYKERRKDGVMLLNRVRRWAPRSGLLLVAAFAIFPPWTRVRTLVYQSGQTVQRFELSRKAYGFMPIWDPPWQKRENSGEPGSFMDYEFVIDWQRLALYWVAVGALTAVAVLARAKPD